MTIKRSIILILRLLVVLITIVVVTFFGFVGYLATHYWWDRDYWNQEKIANAYILFYKDKTNYPRSLADLVKAGYLPEKADWYKEPPGIFPRAVNFSESCYVVQAPESFDLENLDMIGRRFQYNGKEEIDFGPTINAKIRDAIGASDSYPYWTPNRPKIKATNQ
jgi:hypothetical protein